MVGGLQVLGAVLDPPDRTLQAPGDPGHEDLFGVRASLQPEPAANLGCDHGDQAFIEPEALCDRLGDRMRSLRRGPDHNPVAGGRSHHASTFHRSARHARMRDLALHDAVCHRECPGHVARRALTEVV